MFLELLSSVQVLDKLRADQLLELVVFFVLERHHEIIEAVLILRVRLLIMVLHILINRPLHNINPSLLSVRWPHTCKKSVGALRVSSSAYVHDRGSRQPKAVCVDVEMKPHNELGWGVHVDVHGTDTHPSGCVASIYRSSSRA